MANGGATSRRGSHPGKLPPTDQAAKIGTAGRHRHRRCSWCRRSHVFFGGLSLVVVVVFVLGIWQQNSTADVGNLPGDGDGGGGGGGGGGGLQRRGRPAGTVLRFVPADLLRRFEEQRGLDRLRSERGRLGVRPPRLALVTGSLDRDPHSLLLLTLVKSLTELGYSFTIFTLDGGEAHYLWERVCCQASFLSSESSGTTDWSNYEGVILSSLEGKKITASLMEEPFLSVPLVWLIQDDILGRRLSYYELMGWQDLIDQWRSAFSRADVVVFPDFSLPMLYTQLDTGNFFVISGSPLDVWATESYIASHSRNQIRKVHNFGEDDLLILVIGSSYFYDELPWEYAAVMHALVPQAVKLSRVKDLGGVKFVFVFGNSTDSYSSTLQELAIRMKFPDGSVRHFGLDCDVNSLLLVADIVLYGSLHEEQTFPPLLLRAMSFGIPIIAPNLTIIEKYVIDESHGFIFHPSDPDPLDRAFTVLLADKKLSAAAHYVASQGKLLSVNMLASDCIAQYARLLENVLQFPSDAILPSPISRIRQKTWLWGLIEDRSKQRDDYKQSNNFMSIDHIGQRSSIVYLLEEQTRNRMVENSRIENETALEDYPTQLDWDDLAKIEIFEDIERRELQELEERMERTSGSWEEVYRNAKKSEKQKSEGNEFDEFELERTGQPLCIYEIYSGEAAWPFLHNGSIYRGITLMRKARRSGSNDVDAVSRLPILNDMYYRDLLCEMGAMFAVANRVDTVHKLPWIGFQSWRAAGRKVSLSKKAEEVLEEIVQGGRKGDVMYYWASMDMDQKDKESNEYYDFWSGCNHLNAGHCSVLFEEAFRQMYGLPHAFVLPPMPADGGHWSALHSWVMPTPSFLELVMFSRMFVDSLHSLNLNNSAACVLGSSKLEKKHCYCRVLEVLVNVWAYHSARKMIYLNPITGELKEQHPFEEREMWVQYFDFSLLKSMDEDLAEEADDGTHPNDKWLWPLTGEVHYQGILDREREERYRRKMDKKRKTKEKLLERQKHGYKQKSLGQIKAR